MEFALADMWNEFKTKAKGEYGTIDDNCAEVILGPRLNEAVRHLANGYIKRLELGPENKATDERARLLDLYWGKIEHDAAVLEGLGVAIGNLATTLTDGVTKLGESWQGESYTAFQTAMGKICTTLNAYATGAAGTGEGLRVAMEQARSLYQDYAERSVSEYLNFGDVSPPEKWHKIVDWGDKYSGKELAACCPSDHGSSVLDMINPIGELDYNYDCIKNNDEQRRMLTDNFVTERKWEICKQDGCEESLDRVNIMYTNLVNDCNDARDRIKGKLDAFFGATGTLVDSITEMMDISVENLYNLASEEAFSSLRVIAAGGGEPVGGGSDTGGGSGGSGYPGGGGDTGGGSVGIAEPMQPVEEPPAPTDTEPAADEPVAEPAPDAAQQPETVEIKDGDRTISVTSPDGEGRVTVTVDDGTGKTKTYELDFDAASDASPTPPATDAASGTDFGPEGQPAADGAAAEQVPARSDGKCVIQDGPLTITAERPLFAPDSVMVTIDDGSGPPTTYTLDFAEADAEADAEEDTAGPGAAPTAATPGQSGAPSQPAPSGTTAPVEEDAAEPVAGAQPATGAGSATPAGTAAPVPDSQVTTPQAWTADQSGSVSGVLVPEQSDGEAGLASAPDAPEPQQTGSTGMAGSGLPMMGAPGGGSEAGRAGSGWSVHGDLFDSTEPVYSMHGVLGDDEHDAER